MVFDGCIADAIMRTMWIDKPQLIAIHIGRISVEPTLGEPSKRGGGGTTKKRVSKDSLLGGA